MSPRALCARKPALSLSKGGDFDFYDRETPTGVSRESVVQAWCRLCGGLRLVQRNRGFRRWLFLRRRLLRRLVIIYHNLLRRLRRNRRPRGLQVRAQPHNLRLFLRRQTLNPLRQLLPRALERVQIVRQRLQIVFRSKRPRSLYYAAHHVIQRVEIAIELEGRRHIFRRAAQLRDDSPAARPANSAGWNPHSPTPASWNRHPFSNARSAASPDRPASPSMPIPVVRAHPIKLCNRCVRYRLPFLG